MSSDFQTRVFCICGWSAFAPFGSAFHVHTKCCPKCGASKKDWKIFTVRWVSTSKFWNPNTWGSGHWETPTGDKL